MIIRKPTVAQSYTRKEPVMSTRKNIMHVGLDAHASDINVAILEPGACEVSEQWQIAHDDRSLRKLSKRLLRTEVGEVRAVYEAGPCRFALQRKLSQLGIECVVAAPLPPPAGGARSRCWTSPFGPSCWTGYGRKRKRNCPMGRGCTGCGMPGPQRCRRHSIAHASRRDSMR